VNTSALYRKAFYICGIVALLIPLFLLGQPPTSKTTSSSAEPSTTVAGNSSGGLLSQIRDRYDIGQASLGQLDPASETMRLATLGLRGVAATILWQKSDYYKTEKYYDRLSATLNQLSLLQPHFVSVWDSQAHNLAYNVSAEFDDYRERYAWVKKGIDYLVSGTKFNRRQPILQWHLGKYMTQKLGRSDEKRQFRELFRNDESYHQKLVGYGLDVDSSDARGPDRKPDNWLVGRLWFLKAYELVRAGAYCKKNPLYFYAENPYALMYSAEAMEEEGTLDDKAMFAWSRASNEWDTFGGLDIMSTWGHTVQLAKFDLANQITEEARATLDAFVADVRKEISLNSNDKLTPDEYTAVNLPESERTPDQQILVNEAIHKFMPGVTEIIELLPREKRSEALGLYADFNAKDTYAFRIGKYRDQCNYDYWEMRGRLEQKPAAVAARRQVFEADQFLEKGDLDKAVKLYEAAWHNWAKVFRAYPQMMTEESADDILKTIKRYGQAADIEFDNTFALSDFLKYRTLRDRNKAGLEGEAIYDAMMVSALKYRGDLDVPYEVGDPPPEVIVVDVDTRTIQTLAEEMLAEETLAAETPFNNEVTTSPVKPTSDDKMLENMEFLTPEAAKARAEAEANAGSPIDEDEANREEKPMDTPEAASPAETSFNRAPTLVAPE